MLKKTVSKLIGVILTLILIAGCGYSYHTQLRDTTAIPDSTEVFVVNGKSYRCINRDGTWRCEAIAEAQSRTEDSVFNTKNLDAKNPNPQRGKR
jgi:hypothetical protein